MTLILTIALPILLGFSIVSIISLRKSLYERLSLSFGVGIGLISLEMFIISLLGFPLNLATIVLPAVLFLLVLIPYLISRGSFSAGFPSFSRLLLTIPEKILIILIILTVLYVFFDATVKPIINYDDLWRQGSIAKIIFSTGRVLTEQSLELAGPHPYLNPLSQAYIYFGIGSWNDALGKIVFALCFASFTALFYLNLRKNISRLYSLIFTYLLTSFPLMIYHAGTAYSDFMQTFYYSVGIIYLFQWMKKSDSGDLYLSAIFLGIGNFVKQSGIPLWGLAIIVLFVYIFIEDKNKWKSGAGFVLLSTVLSAPWLFFHNSFLMRKAEGFFSIFNQAAITGTGGAPSYENLQYGLPTLPKILYHLSAKLFTYADWQILWFVFLFVLVLYWNKIWHSTLKYLLFIIILDLLMVIYAFYEPYTFQFLVDGTLVNRIVMYQVPIVLFFISLCFKVEKA